MAVIYYYQDTILSMISQKMTFLVHSCQYTNDQMIKWSVVKLKEAGLLVHIVLTKFQMINGRFLYYTFPTYTLKWRHYVEHELTKNDLSGTLPVYKWPNY